MSSTHHVSKKSKLNDDTSSKVVIEYSGQDVPENVTHVRFHPSVVKVKNQAFFECSRLIEVVLNVGLKEIGDNVFRNTALQEINIPSTVTKIGDSAFNGCSNLREVVLNDGLRKIGVHAFIECKSLQSITIPSTVMEIGQSALTDCDSLREVVLSDGLKKIGGYVFSHCSSLQSIAIPSTVTEIDRSVFSGCANLRDVVFNEVRRIKKFAFRGCTSLEHITIPSSITEIDQHAFWTCTELREVVIHNEKIQIGDKSFLGCTSLERFKFPRLSTRLENIIQAGQRDIEAKMDDIAAVEWRSGELVIPVVQQLRTPANLWTDVKLDKGKLDKVIRSIRYYEIKEATTLFELALWKSKIDQAEEANVNRNAHRVEVPGPVKDTILQYL